MLLLPVLLLFIYNYIPMAGIVIAFQRYRPSLGIERSKFIGLDNCSACPALAAPCATP